MAKDINTKMITLAREAKGYTISELSEITKINKSTLSRIEMNMHIISDKHIEEIAKVLDFPINFFYLEVVPQHINDFFYRKRVTMKVKEKSKIDAQNQILRIVYDRLLSMVDIPETKIPNIMPKQSLTPEDIAIMARDFYGIDKGPLKNIINILEKNGIAVILLDSDSELFDGVTLYTDKGNLLIIINNNMSNDRKRFTLAHELGHQIMHLPFRHENELYDKLETKSHDIFEQEANRFAAEFLMPKSDIINDLQYLTYKRLGMLKLYWQVSKRALVYRAKALGCISDVKYKTLMIELSRNGERTNESIEVEIDDPKIFKKLFEVHKSEFHYSNEDLSKALLVSENYINDIQRTHQIKQFKIVV